MYFLLVFFSLGFAVHDVQNWSIITCSFIIQNFADARRQTVIDLMLGEQGGGGGMRMTKAGRRLELRSLRAVFDDEELVAALVGILSTNLVPSEAPPSTSHMYMGLLEPEIRLAETVYDVSRSVIFFLCGDDDLKKIIFF